MWCLGERAVAVKKGQILIYLSPMKKRTGSLEARLLTRKSEGKLMKHYSIPCGWNFRDLSVVWDFSMVLWIMILQRPESDCVYILLSIFSGSASVRCSRANPLSCGNAKQERERNPLRKDARFGVRSVYRRIVSLESSLDCISSLHFKRVKFITIRLHNVSFSGENGSCHDNVRMPETGL